MPESSASFLFRTRLRALRDRSGLTQEQAAERCGIGQKLFQLYELGIKDNPGLKTLEKIARGFGIELHELLVSESLASQKRPTKRKRVAIGRGSS